MPTVTTKLIDDAGGDYTSLAAWEAARQSNLVSGDAIEQAECNIFDDTTNCTIDGWTTSATQYIRVFTGGGQGHVGVWNTNKYRIRSSLGFGGGLGIFEEFVRLEGIQVYSNGTYAQLVAITVGATSDVRIERCLLQATGVTTSLAGVLVGGGTVTCRNTIMYGISSVGWVSTFSSGPPTVTLENVTLAACGTYGYTTASGTSNLKNVYSGGHGTDAYSGTITFTTCAHSTATSFTGSTGSVAYSTANFTNVTGGSEDLHLVGGASATLLTGGTDYSGTYTKDVDGETRTVPYSIGADEIVPAITYTVTGPSSVIVNSTSSVFTVTLDAGAFNGTDTITIICATGSTFCTATAVGGSISGNNTDLVEVTPANAQTSFTFTLTSTGSLDPESLLFDNGQGWTDEDNMLVYIVTGNTPFNTFALLGVGRV